MSKKMDKGYVTTTEASVKAGVSTTTIVSWCEKYHIGKRVGGRWRVDPGKLNQLLEGIYEAQHREDETNNGTNKRNKQKTGK